MYITHNYSKCYLDDVSSSSLSSSKRLFITFDSWFNFDLSVGNIPNLIGLFCTLIKCFLNGGGVFLALTSKIRKMLLFYYIIHFLAGL